MSRVRRTVGGSVGQKKLRVTSQGLFCGWHQSFLLPANKYKSPKLLSLQHALSRS